MVVRAIRTPIAEFDRNSDRTTSPGAPRGADQGRCACSRQNHHRIAAMTQVARLTRASAPVRPKPSHAAAVAASTRLTPIAT